MDDGDQMNVVVDEHDELPGDGSCPSPAEEPGEAGNSKAENEPSLIGGFFEGLKRASQTLFRSTKRSENERLKKKRLAEEAKIRIELELKETELALKKVENETRSIALAEERIALQRDEEARRLAEARNEEARREAFRSAGSNPALVKYYSCLRT